MRTEYDASTAITFLMIGLGIGALATLLMTPRMPAYRTAAPPRPRERAVAAGA